MDEDPVSDYPLVVDQEANVQRRKQKRMCLTLRDKVKAIERHEKGESCRSIAAQMHVGKTQIQTIIKNRCFIRKQHSEAGTSMDRKTMRIRRSPNEILNQTMLLWFKRATDSDVTISGPQFQEKAKKVASALNLTTFKASNGWLESFRKRNHISFGPGRTKEQKANRNEIAFQSKYLEHDFHPDNIFICFEFTLLYGAHPNECYMYDNIETKGNYSAKDLMTILGVATMMGEKKRLLVTGELPATCEDTDHLPVDYEVSESSCLTSEIVCKWLKLWDKCLEQTNRKILLCVDHSVPYYTGIHQYKFITIKSIPAHDVLQLKYLSKDVRKSFKESYRKQLLYHVLAQMDSEFTNFQPISVKDAIYWLAEAWERIPTRKLHHCFTKCGFSLPADVTDLANETDLESTMTEEAPLIPGIDYDLFVSFDNYLDNHSISEKSYFQVKHECEGNEQLVPSFHEAYRAMETLIKYADQHCPHSTQDTLYRLRNQLAMRSHLSAVCNWIGSLQDSPMKNTLIPSKTENNSE